MERVLEQVVREVFTAYFFLEYFIARRKPPKRYQRWAIPFEWPPVRKNMGQTVAMRNAFEGN